MKAEEILKAEFLKFIPQERGDRKMTSEEFDEIIIKEKRIFDLIFNAMETYAEQKQKHINELVEALISVDDDLIFLELTQKHTKK